jgi:diguanylate cyclase (GGDEF)-like protein/PAS domain S-box-containing protein
MDGSSASYVLVALSFAAFIAALAYAAWRRRSQIGGIPLFSVLLTLIWWLLGAALQFASPDDARHLFWAKVQYPAIAALPTLWFTYALRYSRLPRRLPRQTLLILLIEPVLLSIIAWSGKQPALLESQTARFGVPFISLVQPSAFWGWFHMIYSLVLVLLSAALLLHSLTKRPHPYPSQFWASIGAVIIASSGMILDIIGLNPFQPLPATPVAFALAGIVVGLGWIGFRLWGIVPQACHTVFEHITDAVIVLDASNRIVNLNQAACKLIGIQASRAIGQSIEKAWPDWPSAITWPFGSAAVDQEITIPSREAVRSFDLHISPLSSSPNQHRGRVIVLREMTDQRHAEEALRRRDEILDAIGFATKQFMRHAAIEEILPDVFARLGEATRVSRVYLLENQTAADGSITCIYRHEWNAWRIQPHLSIPVLQTFSMPEHGLARWVELLSAGKVIHDHLRNLPDGEQFFLRERGVCSLVVVPILLETQWWGSLGFEDCKTEREWTSLEIDVLRTAADTVGAALQRRQAEQAALRWAEVNQTLLDLTVIIGSTMNISQVLDRVTLAVRTLLPVDRSAILLWDEQQNALLPTPTTSAEISRLPWQPEVSQEFSQFKLTPEQIPLIGKLQQGKEAIAIQSVPDSPLLPAQITSLLRIASLLAVPIIYHDRFTGMLYLDYTRAEHTFTRQEIDLATALARQAGLAIERARLYTQSQEDADELSALYRASSTLLTSGDDLQALAHQIVEVVTGEFDFAYCSVMLLDKERNHLKTIAQRGYMERNGSPIPVDGPGLAPYAARTGDIVYAPDVSQDPRYVQISSRTRSEIVIPLKAGDEVIALLNLESPETNAFDERARRILTAFAGDASLALQNVRLFNAAQIHARQMALLNEITRTALLKTDLHEMLDTLASRMNELISSDHCYITIWDDERQRVLPGGASIDLHKFYPKWPTEPDQPTLTAAVLASNEPITVADAHHSPYILPGLAEELPSQVLLGLPMIVGEQKLGAVFIGFTQEHTFTNREIAICQQATGQIALALAEAWSLETARQRAQEAETLRQAGAIVTSTLKEEEAIQLIMEQLARVVPCDSASVQILHDGYLEIVGGFGWQNTAQVIGLRFPVPGENPNTQVVQQRQPILLGDVSSIYPAFLTPPHTHIRSWLGIPLVLHDQVKGMLAMDSAQADYFAPDQARLASAFADQVAIVMENAHLYQEARQAAERRTILHRVSQEIVTANFDPEQIYTAIHRAAAQLMPTEAFVITLVAPDTTQAEAVYLIDKDGRAPRQSFPREQGLTGKVLAVGKTIYIPDADQVSNIEGQHFGSQEHTRSILALPLRSGDRIIGMISAQSYQPNAYSSEDQYLLEMLAATAAIAIENSRLLKEIQWLAITDPLTGLYNRRGLFQLAEREVERYRRFGRPFCVYMIDIDHFKQINDTHGHAAGDQVLVGLAKRLKQRIRDIDIIGRYGGEELLVVLPETQLAQGLLAAERARGHVEQHPIRTEHGEIPVTISVGVAEIDAQISDLAALVDRADSAMYAAKQAGRNRVMAYRGEKDRLF